MPDPDLTTRHDAPDFLLGLWAFWLGLATIGLRWLQAAGVFLLLVSPVFLVGYLVGGELGVGVANLLLSPITLAFLGYFAFVFVFPAYLDVIHLCGFFFQRCAYVKPAQTVGAVNKRWARVREDFRAIGRYWRARP